MDLNLTARVDNMTLLCDIITILLPVVFGLAQQVIPQLYSVQASEHVVENVEVSLP